MESPADPLAAILNRNVTLEETMETLRTTTNEAEFAMRLSDHGASLEWDEYSADGRPGREVMVEIVKLFYSGKFVAAQDLLKRLTRK